MNVRDFNFLGEKLGHFKIHGTNKVDEEFWERRVIVKEKKSLCV